jgi:hypothetical protein
MATPTTYQELVIFIIELINILIPTLFGVLFVYFIWKVIDCWIINAGDPAKHEEGRNHAIVAVIVFVLMVSAWGIVLMIHNSVF